MVCGIDLGVVCGIDFGVYFGEDLGEYFGTDLVEEVEEVFDVLAISLRETKLLSGNE